MTDLIIRKPQAVGVDFNISLTYNSTKNQIPAPYEFAGFRVFLNNDEIPFAELMIKGKKIWNETIDFTKYLSPGIYDIRTESKIMNGFSSETSIAFVITLGEFREARYYAPVPQPPNFPWPITDKMKESLSSYAGMRNSNLRIGTETYVDEWTLTYPG